MGGRGFLALVVIVHMSVIIDIALAYNCYKTTDKASKPLDLSTHSSSISQTTQRSKRDTSKQSSGALEFDIGDYLYVADVDSRAVEHNEFSVSFWLYLEGGQPSGATILSLKNTCFLYSPWSFRLHPASDDNGMKSQLTFTIEDVYRQRKSVTMDEYQHHTWFQLTVVNSVRQLRMYVNGVRIATDEGMKWKEFADTDCLRLELGREKSRTFRGKLSKLHISHQALSSRNVKQINVDIAISSANVWFDDSLSAIKSNWTSDSPPTAVQELINQKTVQTISAPTCGKTVCDDPAMASAYATDPPLKRNKTVALEIVVMAHTDGTSQSVSAEDINAATEYITNSFSSLSINWQFHTRVVRNSTLRRSFMMLDCWPDMIGDGQCDNKCSFGECCNFAATNYDGGDCSYADTGCTSEKLYNNQCDKECNTGINSFDYDSCCTDINEFCIDSLHENRSYFHLTEVKDSIPTSDDKLSIVVLNWMAPDMLGVASLPWEQNSDARFGSLVVGPSALKAAFSYDTLVHELGHVLGLWHVHHGITEVHSCLDECLEKEPSLVLGDLCADTAPTYIHTTCADPVVDNIDKVCSIRSALTNTPYSNYMSYSNGSCSDEKTFTAQQSARMHCYLDLVHSRALTARQPSAVPLPPQVVYADTQSVTLSWLPPLSAGHAHKICQKCDPLRRLTQYAKSVSMTGSERHLTAIKQEYGPVHATNVPDSASCKLTLEVWSPADYYIKLYTCRLGLCQFNFTFEQAVKPESIRIWIPWFGNMNGRGSPISSIELVTADDEVAKEVKDVHIQCDKPFTKSFQSIDALVNKVVINTYTPHLAFDAVELKSTTQCAACSDCHSLKYKVEREPGPFVAAIVSETLYEDKTVAANIEYSYTITAVNANASGIPSTPFRYTHNQKFCGNGRPDEEEKCDDGNIAGGDGCSSKCEVEQSYVCLGTPSVCWLDIEMENRHCSFKFTNEEDGCGYYVPTGYTDQWASSVDMNGKHLTCSSEHLLLGPPPPGLKCQSELTDLSPPLWLPCQMMGDGGYSDSYQLKLGFEKAVVATSVIIHIANDGGNKDWSIIVSQIYEDDELETIDMFLNEDCDDSPLIVSKSHDLSKPFKRTKEVVLKVTSRIISIAAVRLRTFANYDPVTVNTCEGSLYDSVADECVQPSVTDRSCQPLDLDNANLTCTGVNEGDSCTAICDLGYETNTVSGTTTCVDSQWMPSLTCDIVTCKRPAVALGYAVCPNGHHYSSVCEIACNGPSELRGNGTLIKCVESGTWTEARASCAPICPNITTQNAQPTDDSCAGPQEVGSRCHMTCQTGYYISGYDQKTRRDKAECKKTGKWDKQCVRIECEKIAPVWTGLYTCTDGVNSGSVCTATCPGGQVASAMTCLATGRWNASFSACDTSDTSCPVITGSRQDITFNCTGTSAGSVCRVSCKNTSLSIYQLVGQVSSLFKDKLHCSSSGSWTENISSLSCDLPCDTAYIGDGWCDAVNNRRVCQWDEGDCCAASSKVSAVQSFPESCVSECSCEDPNSQETAVNAANRRSIARDGYAIDTRS